jgi:hypothetical protein
VLADPLATSLQPIRPPQPPVALSNQAQLFDTPAPESGPTDGLGQQQQQQQQQQGGC